MQLHYIKCKCTSLMGLLKSRGVEWEWNLWLMSLPLTCCVNFSPKRNWIHQWLQTVSVFTGASLSEPDVFVGWPRSRKPNKICFAQIRLILPDCALTIFLTHKSKMECGMRVVLHLWYRAMCFRNWTNCFWAVRLLQSKSKTWICRWAS